MNKCVCEYIWYHLHLVSAQTNLTYSFELFNDLTYTNMLSIRYTLSSILFLLFSALFVYSCTTEPPKIYTLTTEAEPVEGGTVTPSNVEIEEKESIQITATPNEHWLFKGWAGDITGAYQQTANVYMDQDRIVTALFERMVYPVTVTIVGEGEVHQEIVQEKAIDDEFESETILRLTAEPKPGWKLVEWTGEINGSTEINTNDPVIEIAVVGPIDIVVKFEKIDYLLSVNIEGKGSVEQEILASSVIETEYPFETVVELKATPKSGWEFTGWTGDINSTERNVIVTIDEEKEVTATFVELPTMSTKPITAITNNSAVSGGSLTNNSNVTIIDKGICWSTSSDTNPETIPNIDCKSADPETNTFDLLIDDLKSNTKYYVRAVAEYSINSNKVVLLGNEINFTTESGLRSPTVSTTSITSITQNSALSGGNVSDEGSSPVTLRGICWKNSPNPTTDDTCTSQGTGSGAFTTEITDLIAANSYWVRAYAINEEGTSYGEQVSFTTGSSTPPPPPPPSGGLATVSTSAASSITINSAVSGGNVTDQGGSTVTVKGICWSTSQNPTTDSAIGCSSDGSGLGAYSTTITGLNESTSYWVRAYATNASGTSYGANESFTTSSSAPPPPPPSGDQVEVFIFYINLVHPFPSAGPADIVINGTTYVNNIGDLNLTIPGIGNGRVLTVTGPISSVELVRNQIRFAGLDQNCFGAATIKIMKKHPNTDFTIQNNSGNSEDINYWAHTYEESGALWDRMTQNFQTAADDDEFYLRSGNKVLPRPWSDSNKLAVGILDIGKNRVSYSAGVPARVLPTCTDL